MDVPEVVDESSSDEEVIVVLPAVVAVVLDIDEPSGENIIVRRVYSRVRGFLRRCICRSIRDADRGRTAHTADPRIISNSRYRELSRTWYRIPLEH